jgi:Fe-S-cluster containining protein
MSLDLTPFFKEYEKLSETADLVFARVKNECPECVKCKTGCADCCYALFDLTLIEALHINRMFNKKFQGKEKEALLERVNKTDRETYIIKKKAYNELNAGKKEEQILVEIAQQRARCSLLNDQQLCEMYDYRPITCKLYGIPTSINGIGHTCGISGFVTGKQYPTVNLDTIQKQLYGISASLVKAIQSKHIKMADMLVPLSMAILTDYDDDYLGIVKEDNTDA